MARDEPQTNLRIPAPLKERLIEASVKSKRSLTAEIVARLEESLAHDSVAPRSIDEQTLDLFADTVAGKVVQALGEQQQRHRKR